MTEARKQQVEKDEHDPENFPEAPQTQPPMAVEAVEAVRPVPVEAAPEAVAPVEAEAVVAEAAPEVVVEEPKAE